MNFLAHLYIAETTGTSYAGAILGDHVRGRLDGKYGAWLEEGIQLHRHVDTFTDTHPAVLGSFQRLTTPFRRYAGILVDIYFDYILASRWPQWHAEPLEQFAQQAGRTVRCEWPADPPFPAARLTELPQLLQSYRRPEGITTALTRVGQRLSRPSPLPRAWPHLQAQADGFAADFETFFPQLLTFAQQQVKQARSADPAAHAPGE